jgi:hypothetical protein
MTTLLTFSNFENHSFKNEANAESLFGCTSALHKWKKDYQKLKYSSFARGRAFTITGMLGCGYSYGQKTQEIANDLAMGHCRKNARNPNKCYISDITK